jgi:hypothetical protein
MQEEKWKDFNDEYKVSNMGKVVRKSKKMKNRYASFVKEEQEIKRQKTSSGIVFVWLFDGDKKYKRTVSNMVAELFLGRKEGHYYIGYKNGNKDDLRADNLYWKKSSKGE